MDNSIISFTNSDTEHDNVYKELFQAGKFAISLTEYWPFAATYSTSQVAKSTASKHGKMGLYSLYSFAMKSTTVCDLPKRKIEKKCKDQRPDEVTDQLTSSLLSTHVTHRRVIAHGAEQVKTGTKAEATCTQKPVQIFCPEVEVVSLALWSCRKGNACQSITELLTWSAHLWWRMQLRVTE